jgi:hypothetical protein
MGVYCWIGIEGDGWGLRRKGKVSYFD